jgi:hypothetical protein
VEGAAGSKNSQDSFRAPPAALDVFESPLNLAVHEEPFLFQAESNSFFYRSEGKPQLLGDAALAQSPEVRQENDPPLGLAQPAKGLLNVVSNILLFDGLVYRRRGISHCLQASIKLDHTRSAAPFPNTLHLRDQIVAGNSDKPTSKGSPFGMEFTGVSP